MPGRLVCDIHFYLYLRFVFGLYHEFGNKRVRWLAKTYCGFICVILIACSLYVFYIAFYPQSLMYTPITVEYLFYVIISLRKHNKYLVEYYRKIPILDDIKINRYIRPCIIIYISVLFFIKFIFLFYHIMTMVDFTVIAESVFPVLEMIVWCVIVVARLPAVFLFALLYTRVKSMRRMLESKEFDCRSYGVYHPRKYMQMYEGIMDALEKTDDPMKLQLFTFVVFGSTLYSFGTLCNLYILKEFSNGGVSTYIGMILAFARGFARGKGLSRDEGPSVYFPKITEDVTPEEYSFPTVKEFLKSERDTSGFIAFILEAVLGSSPILLAAVLSDLVSMEAREILAIVLEKRIECNKERDRAEIQKLFELVKNRPYEYRLWRVVPLDLRTILSFVSFSVSIFIAILQIHALKSTA